MRRTLVTAASAAAALLLLVLPDGPSIEQLFVAAEPCSPLALFRARVPSHR